MTEPTELPHPTDTEPTAGPVDPRVARTRATVLRTATELLVEGGPSAVTIDAIVARSGVARSTIYRHWETRDDIVIAVIAACAPRIRTPDEGLDFETALRDLTHQLAGVLGDPDWARVLPALLALRNQDHGIAQLEQRIEAHQEHAFESVLRRGVAEGRLAADYDVDEALARVAGPLVFACLVGRPPVTPGLADRIVDAFLRDTAATAPDR